MGSGLCRAGRADRPGLRVPEHHGPPPAPGESVRPRRGRRLQLQRHPAGLPGGERISALHAVPGTRDAEVNSDPGAAQYHDPQETDPATIDFFYTNVRLQVPSLRSQAPLGDLRLLLGHSGWYTPDDPPGAPGVQTAALENSRAEVWVELALRHGALPWAPYPWQNDTAEYVFKVTRRPMARRTGIWSRIAPTRST